MDNLITEKIRGFEIKLKTKPGVFSKGGVDAGSKLLIDNMQITDGTLIADVGTGTGIIGLIAAKLNYNGHVHLLADHIRSVELAEENVALNELKNVEVFTSDLFSAVSERTYNLILSNLPQHLGNESLEEIITESLKHLKPKGVLLLVVKNNIRPVIERLFKKVFKDFEIITRGSEYILFKAQK